MRTHLKLPALAIVAVLLVAACSSGDGDLRAERRGASRRPPASAPAASRSAPASAAPSAAAAAPTPEPAKACAQSQDANAMQMWERSGGNKGMVDILVCAWNAANPTKPINLSYIVHTEMVAKIAQGIASGDVPDLMGMDLIYAPQFENAGQLVDITDQTEGLAGARGCQPGPQDRRHVQRPPVRRPAVRRRVGAVLQQGPVHQGRAGSEQAADQPRRDPDVRRQDHRARRRHQGLLPAGQLRRLQHLHRRPADVGVRCDDRGRQVRRRAARRRRRQAGRPVGARHGRGQERPRQRAGRDRRHVRRAVRDRASSA